METTSPFFFLTGFSIPMFTLRAPAWMVSNLPVSPTKSLLMPASHFLRAGGVSRSGSEVTNTTRRSFCSARGSCFTATAMFAIVSGQTSGQLV